MSDIPDHDELVSAYLDDELSTADRLVVESDAVLMTRVEEFRRVHDLVTTPVALDADLAESFLRSALSAVVVEVPPASASVGGRSSARAVPTRSGRPRLPVLVTAAAAAIVIAVIAATAGSHRSRVDDAAGTATASNGPFTAAASTAAAAATTVAADRVAPAAAVAGGAEQAVSESASSKTASSPATRSGATPAPVPTAAASGGVLDLGVVDDAAEIGRRLAGTAPTAAPVFTASPLPTCPNAVIAAVVRFKGTDALVIRGASGALTITDRSCRPLAEVAP